MDPIDQRTLGEILAAIAARTPAPGGGAAAALTAAMSAALVQMVVRYSAGQPDEDLASLERLGSDALRLADADARAFATLSRLWKLPRDDARRRAGWAGAVAAAIAAPRGVMQTALDTLKLLDRLSAIANANLRSDVAIAALLAVTSARSAAWNVRVNLPLVDDPEEAARIGAEVERTLEETDRLARSIEQRMADG